MKNLERPLCAESDLSEKPLVSLMELAIAGTPPGGLRGEAGHPLWPIDAALVPLIMQGKARG